MSVSGEEAGLSKGQLATRVFAFTLFLVILFFPNPNPENVDPETGLLPPRAQRLAAVTVLMAVLWVTQTIPIAATSLIPLAAFPLLGILSAKEVSKEYINENIFLFLGGFMIALGIEKWGLHRRMSLHIVRIIGGGMKRVVLGFMLATAFLSMWISNTASTLLMLPIGLALLTSLGEGLGDGEKTQSDDSEPEAMKKLAAVLMLAIAYSASIGGLTTLVGTPTNLQYQKVWSDSFPSDRFPDEPEISAGEWMMAFVPLGVVFLLCAWGVLVRGLPVIPGSEKFSRSFFSDRLKALGPASRAEKLMLAVFTTTALLWLFRKPLKVGSEPILPGWGDGVAWLLSAWGVTNANLHDSTVAIGMALLMFFLPAGTDDTGKTQYLMDWKTTERLPWGILLLIGGGFAIAGAFQQTGLAEFLGRWFAETFADQPIVLLIGATCGGLTFLTEFTSNVATVSAILPILATAASNPGIYIDPRLIMIPATISTSCAFMLPIATPPNAIVFGSGKVSISQMARYGILLNLIGVVLITAATFLLLVPQLGITLGEFPAWAK
jgi:sodium-dependent dicarboxylate transporter 2/3/5